MTQPLLLIVGQSGRFLAQQAHRAGYPVRVADQFADSDTLAVAEQFQQLPMFTALTETVFLHTVTALADTESCQLIIGTGVEVCYPWLNKLPANIQFAGTALAGLATIINKADWFLLLSALQLPFPAIRFAAPATAGGWLYKSSTSWGGGHIQAVTTATRNDGYYQAFTDGRAGSVLFIADGCRAILLSFNQQFCRNQAAADFTLLALSNTLTITTGQQKLLFEYCQQLTQSLALRGFQSLDFIINNDGQIQLLEINPRPPASLQCLPQSWPIIDWHLTACQGQLAKLEKLPLMPPKLLYFCFAEQDLTIADDFDWPAAACDLPPAGTFIAGGGIICSLLIDLPSTQTDVIAIGQNMATQLQLKLTAALEKPLNTAI